MRTTRSIDMVIDNAVYTESPRWHDGALWFSDIGAGQVCRIGPNGKEVVLEIDTASGLGWTRSGDILVASIGTSTIFRAGRDGVPHPFCGPKQHGAKATNDMATVGSRSYVTCAGHFHTAGDDVAIFNEPIGSIIMIDHDTGEGRTVANGLRMPNGVAVSGDGRTLVVAEVFANRLLRFDIRPDGSLSEPPAATDVPPGMDGIALDAEGAVWSGAIPHRFVRRDSLGNQLDSIEIPGWHCIACMLGGPSGKTLYMAVNQFNTADEIFDGRSKGAIMATEVNVPAAPEPTSAPA